nr:HAMP domain-containing histidine kinase [Acidiferrobacterales bacterium]
VVQTFNRDLAQNLINERKLISAGRLNQPVIKKVFTEYMNINPNIEIYLLNATGKIVSFSAPSESVKLDQVSLEPIHTFLENEQYEPVVGDDPRNPGRRKAFSVAPINTQEGMYGYLYVVLRGNDYDSVERALEQRYLIQLGVQVLVMSLLVGLIAGLLVLWRVTRPLRKLTQAINQQRQQSEILPIHSTKSMGDELQYLQHSYLEMTQRIKQQFARLEQIDEHRRDLVANISHDLRTPLAAVIGYLEVLKDKSGTVSAEQQMAYLDVAFKNAQRLSQLIDDLFELARLEAGGMKLHMEPFSILQVARTVIAQQLPSAQRRSIGLELRSQEALPLASGDLSLIQRVLENLVANAIQHNESDTKVVVKLKTRDGAIQIAVCDEGEAIPDELFEILLNRFKQGFTKDESRPGAGLGLSIAKQILLLHGSQIELNNFSKKGKALSFWLAGAGDEIPES